MRSRKGPLDYKWKSCLPLKLADLLLYKKNCTPITQFNLWIYTRKRETNRLPFVFICKFSVSEFRYRVVIPICIVNWQLDHSQSYDPFRNVAILDNSIYTNGTSNFNFIVSMINNVNVTRLAKSFCRIVTNEPFYENVKKKTKELVWHIQGIVEIRFDSILKSRSVPWQRLPTNLSEETLPTPLFPKFHCADVQFNPLKTWR